MIIEANLKGETPNRSQSSDYSQSGSWIEVTQICFPFAISIRKFDEQEMGILFDSDRYIPSMNFVEFCKTVVSYADLAVFDICCVIKYAELAVFNICCVVIKYADLAVFNISGKTPAEVRARQDISFETESRARHEFHFLWGLSQIFCANLS